MVKRYVRVLEVKDSRVDERDYVKDVKGYEYVDVGLYSGKNMCLRNEVCRWFGVWKYEFDEESGELRMYSKESYEKGEIIGRIWEVDELEVMCMMKRVVRGE
jgi:hypothetical protein